MWVVKRCVQDFDDVFKNEVAQFATDEEADAFADEQDRNFPFRDVWHEVHKE